MVLGGVEGFLSGAHPRTRRTSDWNRVRRHCSERVDRPPNQDMSNTPYVDPSSRTCRNERRLRGSTCIVTARSSSWSRRRTCRVPWVPPLTLFTLEGGRGPTGTGHRPENGVVSPRLDTEPVLEGGGTYGTDPVVRPTLRVSGTGLGVSGRRTPVADERSRPHLGRPNETHCSAKE